MEPTPLGYALIAGVLSLFLGCVALVGFVILHDSGRDTLCKEKGYVKAVYGDNEWYCDSGDSIIASVRFSTLFPKTNPQ